jgi:serine protease Do
MEMEQYGITAEYIGGSLTYDIAVLKITGSTIYSGSSAIAAEIADREVYAGETAIAIGNPEADGISATVGVVSVDSEYLTMTGADDVTEVTFRVMRIDTAVNSGNSGGGLFNDQGELIGIVNAKIMTDDIENIGYAIPVTIVKYATDNIIRNCEGTENKIIKRCLVGVQLEILESSAYYNETTGFTEIIQVIGIDSVVSGGVADGLLQEGDIVKSFTYNGVTIEVTRIFTIVDYSLNFVSGETLIMTVEREGITQNVSIVLGATTDMQ